MSDINSAILDTLLKLSGLSPDDCDRAFIASQLPILIGMADELTAVDLQEAEQSGSTPLREDTVKEQVISLTGREFTVPRVISEGKSNA